jgi:hypothetical protein
LLSSVHTLFTPARHLLPASGWRLETEEKTDKKKSDFYFFRSRKKFLTEKIICLVARFCLVWDKSGTDLIGDFPAQFCCSASDYARR